MQVIGTPYLPPGACWFTANSIGPFIDTGIDCTYESPLGRVYVQADVVGEMAALLGWEPARVTKILREYNTELIERVGRLENLVGELTTALQAAQRAVTVATEIQPLEIPASILREITGQSDDVVEVGAG